MNAFDQVRQFFPSGPNLTPFMAGAPIVAVIIGLILGAGVIVGILVAAIGYGKFVFAAGNLARREAAIDTMRHGAVTAIIPFIIGAIATIYTLIMQQIG